MNRNKLSITIAMLFMICAFPSYAMNIYRCGPIITGQEYNDVWKQWFNKTISVWVGVENNKGYIFVEAETGLGKAIYETRYSDETVSNLKKVTSKAQKWSSIARENKADASKSLGCFAYNGYNPNGKASDEGDLGLQFFSANNGTQTNMIVSVIDRDNQFKSVTIYLDDKGMSDLLKAIEELPSQHKKAIKMSQKEKLFQ